MYNRFIHNPSVHRSSQLSGIITNHPPSSSMEVNMKIACVWSESLPSNNFQESEEYIRDG